MYSKVLASLGGICFLAGSSAIAIAQDNNPNSAAYHALHNAQSPYYVGPQNQQQRVPQTLQPTGYWEKTWGAIAPSPKGGVLGTSVGAKTKQDAERQALADCRTKGGASCIAEFSYHNQCAVMVFARKKYRFASAASLAEASKSGIEFCEESGDSNCRVFYSACTEPIFHRY